MAVGKSDLNCIVADRGGGLCPRFGLEHGQYGRRRQYGGRGLIAFLIALFVAGSAWAFIPQIREIIMAGVAIGPGYVHASVIRDVNFDTRGLFALVDGSSHRKN